MTKALIIDMDDTLIECHSEYKKALATGGKYIEGLTGLKAELATELISQIDLVSVKHSMCFQKNRFPDSFGHALIAACRITGNPRPIVSQAQVNEAVKIGASVFEAEYPVFPGVIHALTEVKSKGIKMVLYTKGDPDVQKYKIEKHQFNKVFDHIMIIPNKSTGRLMEAMLELELGPTTTIVVGDSLKDDIAPAKSLGIRTVHVAHSDAWSYGDHDVKPDVTISSFAEIINMV